MDNPKDLAATRDNKPRLDLLEHCADVQIAGALHTGAVKYGVANYHTIPILARVYGGAIRRHVGAWLSGEDLDPDSGLSHLAHIGANVHVVLAAIERGTFKDDRGTVSSAANLPRWWVTGGADEVAASRDLAEARAYFGLDND